MLIGITNAILLLAIGIGYIVCYLAKREEGALRATGYVIGVVIIGLGAILLVNNILLDAKFCKKMNKAGCGMMSPHHKMMKGDMESAPAMSNQPQK